MKFLIALLNIMASMGIQSATQPYCVVDTAQTQCYDDRSAKAAPRPGQPFYGQDAQYQGSPPAYKDNGDGTVSDLNTGLMWVRARGQKVTWDAAMAGAQSCAWRIVVRTVIGFFPIPIAT